MDLLDLRGYHLRGRSQKSSFLVKTAVEKAAFFRRLKRLVDEMKLES